MKKLAILVCVVAIPYTLYNLATIVSLVTADGWNQQAVTNLLILGIVLLFLGLAGAGLSAVVNAALKKTSEN